VDRHAAQARTFRPVPARVHQLALNGRFASTTIPRRPYGVIAAVVDVPMYMRA
jgi:hypothetical protein